jgi:phage recombination protein Bet
MHVAQRTGLDPFARQIYMIERQGKQTIQTGIDGFRLVARRAVDQAGESLSIGGGEWCGPDGAWRDVWLDQEPPAAARVVVKRAGHEFVGVALFREYAQYKRDGGLMVQWATRPAGMLAKCAEALALRKAFPLDLAGVYTDDEVGRLERPTRPQQSALGEALATAPLNDLPDETVDVEAGTTPRRPRSTTCSTRSRCPRVVSRREPVRFMTLDVDATPRAAGSGGSSRRRLEMCRSSQVYKSRKSCDHSARLSLDLQPFTGSPTLHDGETYNHPDSGQPPIRVRVWP